MSLRISSSSVLYALSLLLTACGGASDRPLPGGEDPHPKPIEGAVSPVIESILSSPFKSECDVARAEQMTAIGRDLDQRMTQIDEARAAEHRGEPGATREFGPTYLLKDPEFEADLDEWTKRKRSWTSIIADYELAKRDGKMKQWMLLDARVRGILSDDQSRAEGYPYLYGRGEKERFVRIASQAAVCADRDGCVSLSAMSAEDRQYLRKASIFRELLDCIDSKGGESMKFRRECVLEFDAWMDSAQRRYVVRVEPTVKRVSASEFRVKLDPGVFSDAKEVFKEIVEKSWQNDKYRVVVDFEPRNRLQNPLNFILKLHASSGERSYVSASEREMMLTAGDEEIVLAHEFGHVLGIRDRYYTTWDDAGCEYANEVNYGWLMSGSGYGSKVMPLDWQELDQAYPAAAN